MAPPVLALARLIRDDAGRPQPGPLALLGPPGALDRVAARLLAGGGDRRALAPLGRADRGLLASCSAVVACNLPLDEARRVAHAKRPTLLLVPFGQDRYVYGSLPRVGAENALPALPDGAPDLDGMIARLAVVLGRATGRRSRLACRRSCRTSASTSSAPRRRAPRPSRCSAAATARPAPP